MSDPDREYFWDGVHLMCYAVMIPGLFFLAGIFTPDSLQRRGMLNYFWERVIKLLIPMGIGVFTVSPILQYFRAQFRDNMSLDFFNYYIAHYLEKNIALTGFWFLGYLFVFTIVYLLAQALLPFLNRWLRNLGEMIMKHPIVSFWVLGGLISLSFTILTIRYGSFYWVGYQYFFTTIGSFVGAYIILFTAGVSLGLANAHKNRDFCARMDSFLPAVLVITCIVLLSYLTVAMIYIDDGAYSDRLPFYFYTGGEWPNIWPELVNEYVLIIRAALHGFSTWMLIVLTLMMFYRFLNKPQTFWQTMAANSFVIYLIHEPFVLAQHMWMMNTQVPLVLRVVLISGISLFLSWLISEKLLRRFAIVRRVVG